LSHGLLRDARFYGVLFLIDVELADEVRSERCECGGRLHSARYRRKPRCGVDLEQLDPDYAIRFSFCCDRDGCRRRRTPPSVRFLGRRVYAGAVVVLIAALAEGATPRRLRRLRQLVGDVSRRTVERWRRWWRESFPQTPFWREHRARFAIAIDADRLPALLLERMSGADPSTRLIALLRFLMPITATTTRSSAHAS
jgi:hypothetical protein